MEYRNSAFYRAKYRRTSQLRRLDPYAGHHHLPIETSPRVCPFIAVLGFAQPCDWENQYTAFLAGRIIAESGYGVIAGHVTSTFSYAFQGALAAEGVTTGVIENWQQHLPHEHCRNLCVVDSTRQKHELLVASSRGAIVIGGGNGTKSLVKRFLYNDKPVAAITDTGGVVNNELPDKTVYADTPGEAVQHVLRALSFAISESPVKKRQYFPEQPYH